MKLFMFLDDWFLDSKVDIVRRFPKAVSVPIPDAPRLARAAIVYDEEQKHYLAAMTKGKSQDKIPSMYTSADGIHWRKKKQAKFRFFESRKKVSFQCTFPFEQGFYYDKWDSDPGRRYKMLLWPYSKPVANTGPSGNGVVGCSPDGFNWMINPKYTWYKSTESADTNNNMFYNPFTKHWCAVTRKTNLDRRVTMAESADLEHWTEPRVILQPDVLDNPFLQFYGMTAALYEDEYFIGLPQCYHVPMQEINVWSKGRVMMQGSVDPQLAYSYDGQYWLRSDRSTIIPRTEPGTYGGACIYPSAIVDSPDRKKIYIYSIGVIQDHERGGQIPHGYLSREALMLHTLRRDGFACLEPVGGWGQFITKTLIPKSGKLTINYQAPVGQVLVQVTDSKRKPLPGYSFSDCTPLTGDEINGKPRWKKHRNLSNLVGKPIRIEFRLFDARIYAIRLDCKLWYGFWPGTEIERV